ncbi:hypothetical protein AURDEDRAFT_179526 [Auricularia subglabra TFB-10046 SS5]|nr:hypothetical protein AURDEDRAFT_179526 [Auricularia subglabra TFB-10046 SS5]
MSGSSSPTAVAVDHQQELDLLHRGPDPSSIARALASAPIVTYGAMRAIGEPSSRALLGRELGMPPAPDTDTRVYINSAAAWTGIILGQQGSGRSHTAACILESCTLLDPRIGRLEQPMATLVCYYDDADTGRPCKSVSLAAGDSGDSRGITVLVSKRRLKHMRKVYPSDRISVLPLELRDSDISPSILLRIFDDASPRLRRVMRTKLLKSPDAINYLSVFKEIGSSLSESEREEFLSRTEFLEDLLVEHTPGLSVHFSNNRAVVLDFSDPFVQPSAAGNLFSVVTHAFSCWNDSKDKVALLDNVHTYLPVSPVLRDSLTNMAKRTRAQNLRLLLAAQEPTVFSHDLLDAASFVICHKLASPPLSDYLGRLVDDASRSDTGGHQEAQWRRQLIELFPGEAVLFSSGALVLDAEETPALLGSGQLTLCVRERVSGGPSTSSALATPRSSHSHSSATSASSSKHNSPPTVKATLAPVPETPSSTSQVDQTTSTLPSFTSSFVSASPLLPPPGPELSMPQPSRVLPKPEFFVPPAATPTAQIPAAPPTPAAAAPNQIPAPNTAAVRQSAPPLRNTPSADRPSRKQPPTTTSTSSTTSTSTTPSTLPASGIHAFWQPPSSARSETSRPQRHKVTMEELEEELASHAAPALDSASGHILEPVNRNESRSEPVQLVPSPQSQTQAQLRPQPQAQPQPQPHAPTQVQPRSLAQPQSQPQPQLFAQQPHPQPQVPAHAQTQSYPTSHLQQRPQPQHHVHASTRQRVSTSVSQQYASLQMQPPNAPKRPTSPVISVRSMSIAPPKRFAELISVMEAFAQRGETRPSKSDVAAAVGEGFIGTGFVTFRGYSLAAEKAGIIRRGGTAGTSEWMELVQ